MKRVICLICCFSLFIGVLVSPASAASVTYEEITLSSPDRVYNDDDDTVTVTYDLPLDPFSEVYGYGHGSDAPVLLWYSDQVLFVQQSEEVISYVESTIGNATATGSTTSYSTGFYAAPIITNLFGTVTHNSSDFTSETALEIFENTDAVIFDGTLYYVSCFTSASGSNFYLGNGAAFSPIYDDNGLPFLLEYSTVGSVMSYVQDQGVSHSFVFVSLEPIYEYINAYDSMYATCYPLGYGDTTRAVIDVSDIKSDANVFFKYDVDMDLVSDKGIDIPTLQLHIRCLDKNFNLLDDVKAVHGITDGSNVFNTYLPLQSGTKYIYLEFTTGTVPTDGIEYINLKINSLSLSCDLSSVESNSQMMTGIENKLDDLGQSMDDLNQGIGDANDKLDDIGQGLDDANDSLDDIGQGLDDANDKLDGIDQGITDANGKLDDVNNNMETLPNEIGNEIQNVIDNENDKAKVEGDEAAGALIELIPDQSDDVIAAMGVMVSALKYEGTEAVLTLPTVKIPSMGSLFGEVTLMEEQEVDIGSWFDTFPSSIISIIRALFDVAIVGFCFKEFIGLLGEFLGNATQLDD